MKSAASFPRDISQVDRVSVTESYRL